MPKKVLEKLIEADPDCCCPWGFFYSRRHWNTAKIALATGLTKRSIRYWKRKIKLREVYCSSLFEKDGIPCNKVQQPKVTFIEIDRRSSPHFPAEPSEEETLPSLPPQSPDTA